MIIYNITINIDPSVHDEWLEWMREHHIPEVMSTGMFIENRMLRVLGEESEGGRTYSIQYTCKTMAHFQQYEQKFAPALRAELVARYKEKFVAFRTLLETID